MGSPRRKLLLVELDRNRYTITNNDGLPITRVPDFHLAGSDGDTDPLLSIPVELQRQLPDLVESVCVNDRRNWAVVNAGRYIEDTDISPWDDEQPSSPPSREFYAVIIEEVVDNPES